MSIPMSMGNGSNINLIAIYVDDLLIACSDLNEVNLIKSQISERVSVDPSRIKVGKLLSSHFFPIIIKIGIKIRVFSAINPLHDSIPQWSHLSSTLLQFVW